MYFGYLKARYANIEPLFNHCLFPLMEVQPMPVMMGGWNIKSVEAFNRLLNYMHGIGIECQRIDC